MEYTIEQPSIDIFKISDPHIVENGLAANWGSTNELIAYALPPSDLQGERDVHTKCSFNLHSVRWDQSLVQPIARKLINESHLTFTAFHNEIKEQEEIGRSIVVEYSKKYRSILRSCFLELQDLQTELYTEEITNQMGLYKIMELIWNLCEILFLENLPDGNLLLVMLDWCKWNFPVADELVTECTSDLEDISEHPRYWDAMYALILQGRLQEARNLLKLSPLYSSQTFASMDELLRKMPIYSYNASQTVNEFEMKWNYWQDECRKRYRDGVFNTNSNLLLVCRLLCGEVEAFQEVSPILGSWYHLLVSYHLYSKPTISAYDIHYHSKIFIEMFGGMLSLNPIDKIILAALQFDASQVIRDLCLHFSDWWLPTHLTGLLHYCKVIPDEEDGNLNEFLIIRYGGSLAGIESYWNVVVDYFANAGSMSDNFLQLFVQRIPVTTEVKASKVLRVCEKYGFTAEAKSICRQMSVKAIKQDLLGEALMWCIKANDTSFAMYIADMMLDQYARTGSFPNIDIIDNLGPSVLMSKRLTFLSKYRDFHRLYDEEKYKEAGLLLLHLLVSKTAPLNFWISLLMDCLPLLDRDDLIYGTNETADLLSCLNSLDQQSKEAFKDFSSTEKENQLNKMKLLRLSLANNLARAIVS